MAERPTTPITEGHVASNPEAQPMWGRMLAYRLSPAWDSRPQPEPSLDPDEQLALAIGAKAARKVMGTR